MPTLTIDGREVNAPDGTTVIQAAEQLEIFVPRYCYHPALSVAGNCRICLVEVENMPKLQIACNTQVSEGMVVGARVRLHLRGCDVTATLERKYQVARREITIKIQPNAVPLVRVSDESVQVPVAIEVP